MYVVLPLLPEIVCAAGILLYLMTDHKKAEEVGRLMFWTGLVVTLAYGIHHS